MKVRLAIGMSLSVGVRRRDSIALRLNRCERAAAARSRKDLGRASITVPQAERSQRIEPGETHPI
jgi:hypothetical protein